MKYTVEKLIKSKEEKNYLFFWGHQPSPDGIITKSCFSQWWISPFTVDGITYPSAEHFMMAEKARLFHDTEQLHNILNDPNPAHVKKYGRKVKDFDTEKWNQACYEIVKQGNYHKFSQNEELKKFLLSTKNDIIVEASPYDTIWGIGMQKYETNLVLWRGTNLLGFALMEVRDKLRKD